MDDPLFDPWGAEAEGPLPPAVTPRGRWRAPEGPPPSPPPARAEPRTGPAPTAQRPQAPPRARLAGTLGFVRTMAMPRLHDLAQRLQLARHEAAAEDLLDGARPAIRVTFRPWRGPWTDELSPPWSLLELVVESAPSEQPSEQIVVRTWLDAEAAEPTDEVSVPPSKLGAAWLEALVLEFVERVLARA